MLIKQIFRNVFYTTQRPIKKLHSDNRDAYEYVNKFQTHEDIRLRLKFITTWSRHLIFAWGVFAYIFYTLVVVPSKKRETFEIKYLNQQPKKDYEAEDYDYKFWELIRTKKTEKNEVLVNTETATREKYVLIYLAKTTDSGIKMQRFSRLQKYILLRKDFPLSSIFVGMDEHLDPDVLDEYTEQYSKDLIAAYPQDENIRSGLIETFINLGCIYLLERSTGNVLCIIDPEKHALEAIGTKLIYTISKNMDFRLSNEIIAKEINFKSGKVDELAGKLPLY